MNGVYALPSIGIQLPAVDNEPHLEDLGAIADAVRYRVGATAGAGR